MLSVETVWERVLENLSVTMNPTSFANWIQVLTPVTLDADGLLLSTESEAVYKTVDLLYISVIHEAIAASSGEDIPVRLHLGAVNSAGEIEKPQTAPMLNPKYTFDTFVVGESNQFAHAAALAVADSTSVRYNPLFLYGGVGLGKTHLMHAIGNEIYRKHPDMRILYVSSETFTNELIQTLRDSEVRHAEFRRKYRDVDVFMIDDIQFIAGKPSTQSEIFHTFNTLFLENKQIVITSDRPPHDIPTLDDRMTTRFSSGIVADIQSPDFETRAAILRNRAEIADVSISNELLNMIAEKVDSNIRELEGAFNTIVAQAQLTSCKISSSLIERVLRDIVQRSESRRITMDMVIQAVSDYYQTPVSDITGKKRDKNIALARQVAMYLCRDIIETPYRDIGDAFGGKHYSTVIHAYESIAERLKSAPGSELQVAVEDITSRLKNL